MMDAGASAFLLDDSTLIDAVEPVTDALAICGAGTAEQAELAMKDREDYLNDYNFLKFLRKF